MSNCQSEHDCENSADYLVVLPAAETWLCEPCFHRSVFDIALQASAVYYLPTCAQVELTVRDRWVDEHHQGDT